VRNKVSLLDCFYSACQISDKELLLAKFVSSEPGLGQVAWQKHDWSAYANSNPKKRVVDDEANLLCYMIQGVCSSVPFRTNQSYCKFQVQF
jgi:hypothetical protein